MLLAFWDSINAIESEKVENYEISLTTNAPIGFVVCYSRELQLPGCDILFVCINCSRWAVRVTLTDWIISFRAFIRLLFVTRWIKSGKIALGYSVNTSINNSRHISTSFFPVFSDFAESTVQLLLTKIWGASFLKSMSYLSHSGSDGSQMTRNSFRNLFC